MHAIKKGCVVALPYERLFGLAANAFDPEAVARVAAIKGRPADVSGSHPISVIAPDIDAVRRVTAEFSPLAHRLAEQYWPGLLTIVVKAAAGLPPPLVGRDGLIGVRIPGSCPAAELAGRSGLVLTATSANPAGCKDAISHEDVAGLNGVDLIVEGRVAGPPGSTVVDASGKYPNVIRSGFITLDEEI
ncbi:MAG: L-threonylcarbamoyladenylate synthase [Proteobacteria bacterium]|nr:L-threonylcarbamoyladenylate synthase [Pseudomonadota bacterium]